MSTYSDINFKYEFRDYQQRVLDSLGDILNDNKIHVVAAPGSGKTVLGLEIIRRLDRPVLILVPSVGLRKQWCERFLELFVPGKSVDEWKENISNDIDNPKIITCVTYQAIHSHFAEGSVEHLAKKYNVAGVTTICLDEAHHLKREWWKALEEFCNRLNDNVVISLTATPPYDANDEEWAKYNSLCGEIDIEIFTPEMVQKKCLCPHQDYVVLCIPTKEEARSIETERNSNLQSIEKVLKSRELYDGIKNNTLIINAPATGEKNTNVLVEHPDYLMSMLSYLKQYWIDKTYEYEEGREAAENVQKLLKPEIREALSSDVIMQMDLDIFETLMKGILEYDLSSYNDDFIEHLRHILAKNHMLYNNRLIITKNERKLEDKLKKSVSRLVAIEDIVRHESECMGDNLRCVILVDYVRKEDLSKISTVEELTDIGCVPVFERLRRMEHAGNINAYMSPEFDKLKTKEVRLGMISGGLLILPTRCMNALGYVSKELGVTDYSYAEIQESDNNSAIYNVTELLSKGEITVLVGTAALLGEGWDAPCVNTVIIGSVACTYVMSNQMRGRGLRTDAANDKKVANIWHMATVIPNMQVTDEYKKICRRFNGITGISYDGKTIENGIEKIGLKKAEINTTFSYDEIMKYRDLTYKYSANRERTYNQWENFMGRHTDLSRVRDVIQVPVKPRFTLFDTRRKVYKKGAVAIYTQLKSGQLISPNVLIIFSEGEKGILGAYLLGATTRENALFSEALKQFMSPIVKPRYIIEQKHFLKKPEYYAVPDAISRNRAEAEKFFKTLNLNRSALIYTRNLPGQEKLLNIRLNELKLDRKQAELVRRICI